MFKTKVVYPMAAVSLIIWKATGNHRHMWIGTNTLAPAIRELSLLPQQQLKIKSCRAISYDEDNCLHLITTG